MWMDKLIGITKIIINKQTNKWMNLVLNSDESKISVLISGVAKK